MRKGKIGIVANPQSGRDIRRLVAHASVFDNEEKVNIVERMLSVFDKLGLDSILYMPDSYGIVEKAAERIPNLQLKLQELEMLLTHTEEDSTRAGKLLQNEVSLIIVIGGDGTHRAVVKGLDLNNPTPIAGISTGTNNVFPSMVEATAVALASFALATHIIEKEEAARKEKILKLFWNNEEDIALIDIVFSSERFIGSKALWNPETIKAIFSSRAEPQNIGFSSLPGVLSPSERSDPFGSYVIIDKSENEYDFPIAPGKLVKISVSDYGKLLLEKPFLYQFDCGTIALDGERKLEIYRATEFRISVTNAGPFVVDINSSLKLASKRGLFKSSIINS